ncbi:NADPH-dependent glutamate synthase beta chain [Desulfonatronum thiosulfatophilum]|uniref:NADPH-dependent glutamate synthase beta chain n=1 Tax=Desulfonatronum thiosulfatophilum TaxID=617002 RepID=A0A1G6B160_9BACT|nr:FAD-dependent oxidoreductase [Desulfonatronum thiosulfatophilum]SDB14312.1 NADPH-dependent glutamate synthase beta chain [Desulfonatronum thiosulfatophilum]
MSKAEAVHIAGTDETGRVSSRILEERIQEAVRSGACDLEVAARGQHGIGGRLFQPEGKPITVRITGSPGQRTGSMGSPGTTIEIHGPASDDIGWLNAGAEIIVHGYVTNGACNAMAQGKVFVGGPIGSRGMTMTKFNPRFSHPELWVLGSAGDYFAEFMAGGVAVVCGHEAQDPSNVLGYRPCVGMVGGKIFFRGPIHGYSQADAKLTPISDEEWQWLTTNMENFLDKVHRKELLAGLTIREEWQCLSARTPMEKIGAKRRSMSEFRRDVWDKELGRGGMIGDLTNLDRSPIPLITTGDLRRYVPVWEHRKYLAPCQAACPTGMPVQERWRLIREGKVDEAVDVALAFTPFPASICGYLCPHLCMQGCTKGVAGGLQPVDITDLGRKGVGSKPPKLPELSGTRVAVIGGGPAGISVAWQLRLKGHDTWIYDMEKVLGGKMATAIPEQRIPREVLEAEVERARQILPHIHLQQNLTHKEFEQLKADFDYVVIATGAQKPRTIPIPGAERIVPALTFLKSAKLNNQPVGRRLVIIGAGNVGCDVATEGHRLGAEEITLIDIQEPASFGEERKAAERAGAVFRYPCFTKEITPEGVMLTTGEVIPADTVVISIGDLPDLGFLPESILVDRGFVLVNENHQTSDPQVFAIGDIVKPGLLTDAIGAGRKAARIIDEMTSGKRPLMNASWLKDYPIEYSESSERIDYSRMTLEYYDPRITELQNLNDCASQCSSCGSCMDCGLCDVVCPAAAIERKDQGDGKYERAANPDKCIGCGFCGKCCPCGVWDLVENTPMG